MFCLMLGIVAGVVGLAKSLDASVMADKAKEITNDAQSKHQNALERLAQKRQSIESDLSTLGKEKLSTESNYLLKFAETYGELRRISYKKITLSDKTEPIEGKYAAIIEFDGKQSSKIVSNGFKGLSTGASVAYGAVAVTQWIGIASTGAAIATLSGAAATNATLAYLGGGSLVAGGSGVSGGVAVLGGLIAGPALLVMGFSAAADAEKILTEANGYSSQIDIYVAQIHKGIDFLEAVEKRISEINSAIIAVRERFTPILAKTQKMIQRKIKEYDELSWYQRNILRKNPLNIDSFSVEERQLFESFTHLGLYLYTLIKTPVFNDESKLNNELGEVLEFFPKLRDDKHIYPVLNPKNFTKIQSINQQIWFEARKRSESTGFGTKVVYTVIFISIIYFMFGDKIKAISSSGQGSEEETVPTPQKALLPAPDSPTAIAPTEAVKAEVVPSPPVVTEPPTIEEAYQELYASYPVIENISNRTYVKKFPAIVGRSEIVTPTGDHELVFIGMHNEKDYSGAYSQYDTPLDIIVYRKDNIKGWYKLLEKKQTDGFLNHLDKFVDNIKLIKLSDNDSIYYFTWGSDTKNIISMLVRKDKNGGYEYTRWVKDFEIRPSNLWIFSAIHKDGKDYVVFGTQGEIYKSTKVMRIVDDLNIGAGYGLFWEVCREDRYSKSDEASGIFTCESNGFTNLPRIDGSKTK